MPRVSVIVPCYNEQATIWHLLNAIYAQHFPRQELEVVIADGLSTDQTRQVIARFQHENPDLHVRIVDNPKRIIPAGVNRALEASVGDYIMRLDAHSVPRPDYIARCVTALEKRLGDNVGGVWEIQPSGEDWQARGIAAAAAHPFGAGDAAYRLGGAAREVDTVPFGSFRRELIKRIGRFDESLLTNEDYEFNVRIRQAGGKIWLDPAIRATYFARQTFRELARQYLRYGYWKARMIWRYPRTIRWRQLPGLFVLSFILLGFLGIWFPVARSVLAVEAAVYVLVLLIAGVQLALRNRDPAMLASVPIAIAIMHFAWGGAFLWSIARSTIIKE